MAKKIFFYYYDLPMKKDTSWEKVDKWYNTSVGEKGHYYHQQIIFPKLLKILKQKKIGSILDLGCGQGVFARMLPKNILYTGVDLSPSLIKAAKSMVAKDCEHQFFVGDVTKELSLESKDFDLATMILCLQNMHDQKAAIQNAGKFVKKNGYLAIVLNHPCFRIPRQSSWQIDQAKKIQYRRIDRYMSPLEIPIEAHPGKKDTSTNTWTFHHPLSAYFLWLSQAGFSVTLLEEWCSNKESVGGAAKMENRARDEFPLFLTLICKKI